MSTEQLERTRRPHRPLALLTVASALLTAVTLAGLIVDDRIVTGAAAWLKPFKFAVSFLFYAGALTWLLAVLPRRSRIAEWAGTVIVGVSVLELAIITLQAARGVPSHYNVRTAFDEQLWSAMGTSIMVLFIAHFVIAVAVLRQRIGDRSISYAIRLGLGLSLLGMLAAVPMVTPMQDPGISGVTGAHSVGVPDGGPAMPVTGWSTTGGDLRIGHFIGMHALQFLPLLAFLLIRYARRVDEVTRARLILVAGFAYGGLTVLATWQALHGQPLLRPDMLTLTAFAVLVAVTGVATVAVLKRGVSS